MPDIDDELNWAGARWRAGQREPVVDLARVMTGSRSRRVAIAAVATLVVIVPMVIVMVLADRPSARPHVSVAPTTAPSTRPASRPDMIELNSEIVQPDVLAVDGTSLWVTGYAPIAGHVPDIAGVEGPAHLQQIDSETGKLVGDVTLPDNGPAGVQVGDGALWVSAQQGEESTETLKIDTATMRIAARTPGLKDGTVAVTPDAVWITDGVGGLRRIDPATARVVTTIDLHSNLGIYATLLVAAGPLGVFVGNGYSGTIQRIDPATNTAGREIHIAADLAEMVELDGSLWVERSDGTQLIEVRDGSTVVRTIDLPERGYDLATDGKDLWIGTISAEVMRVDPATSAVSGVPMPTGTRTNTVAADPVTGAVWATSMTPTPRLLRIPTDASTAQLSRPCPLRSCPKR